MNKEAPPLIKCLPALSSLTTKPKIETQPFQDVPNTWRLGYSFMNLNKDRYQSVFTYGRCIIIILGLVLGLTIYFWGKELYGYKGALLALSLYVFNPNNPDNLNVVVRERDLKTTELENALILYLKKTL